MTQRVGYSRDTLLRQYRPIALFTRSLLSFVHVPEKTCEREHAEMTTAAGPTREFCHDMAGWHGLHRPNATACSNVPAEKEINMDIIPSYCSVQQ